MTTCMCRAMHLRPLQCGLVLLLTAALPQAKLHSTRQPRCDLPAPSTAHAVHRTAHRMRACSHEPHISGAHSPGLVCLASLTPMLHLLTATHSPQSPGTLRMCTSSQVTGVSTQGAPEEEAAPDFAPRGSGSAPAPQAPDLAGPAQPARAGGSQPAPSLPAPGPSAPQRAGSKRQAGPQACRCLLACCWPACTMQGRRASVALCLLTARAHARLGVLCHDAACLARQAGLLHRHSRTRPRPRLPRWRAWQTSFSRPANGSPWHPVVGAPPQQRLYLRAAQQLQVRRQGPAVRASCTALLTMPMPHHDPMKTTVGFLCTRQRADAAALAKAGLPARQHPCILAGSWQALVLHL